MGLLSFLGFKREDRLKPYIEANAIIIDVRSKAEFINGHIKGTKNIPLDQIERESDKIKKWNAKIITCCRSGMRSGRAASLLKQNGIDAINGGSWNQLEKKLQQ